MALRADLFPGWRCLVISSLCLGCRPGDKTLFQLFHKFNSPGAPESDLGRVLSQGMFSLEWPHGMATSLCLGDSLPLASWHFITNCLDVNLFSLEEKMKAIRINM